MSDSDRRFEITGTQIVASLLAAITGAIAASYLGIAGTIIGTAVMSVASTAGAAVYKAYLGRTARRLKAKAPVIAQRAAERMTPTSTRGGTRHGQANGNTPTRADQTRLDQTRTDRTVTGQARLDQTRTDRTLTGQAHVDQTRADRTYVVGQTAADQAYVGQAHEGQADDEPTQVLSAVGGGEPPARPGRGKPGRRESAGWLRRQPRWVLAALVSLAIFVGAVAGVSVVELAAGKPLSALVWHHKGTGTTVGGLVGGQSSPTKPTTPATHPATTHPATTAPASTAPTSPSPSPSVTPTSPSPSPTPTATSPSASTSPTAGATHTS
jgi:hypothetical protein